MAHLSLTPDLENLIVELPFFDKLVGFHGTPDTLLWHVRDARPWTGGVPIPDTARFQGLFLHGKVTEGTERLLNGKRCFYDVRDPTRAIVIELDHDWYERLIVEVDDLAPEAAARMLVDYAERARKRHSSRPPAPA